MLPVLPFSLLPFIMSYMRLTGAVISLLHRTLVYLKKEKEENRTMGRGSGSIKYYTFNVETVPGKETLYS